MINPEVKFPINARVRLRDGIDPDFYGGFSRTGNEGWIRERKLDKYGYPLVRIQWNQNSWSYNGTKDCWTHEGHFELAEENPMNDDQDKNLEEGVKKLADTFTSGIMNIIKESSPERSDTSNVDEYNAKLIKAAEALSGAKAFMVIALHEDENRTGIFPTILRGAQNEEFELVCQHQLMYLVAALHEQTIAESLQALRSDD